MTETETHWYPNDSVGTAPIYGYGGKRVGTRYFYLKNWPACADEKGFRIRPKFETWLKESAK